MTFTRPGARETFCCGTPNCFWNATANESHRWPCWSSEAGV